MLTPARTTRLLGLCAMGVLLMTPALSHAQWVEVTPHRALAIELNDGERLRGRLSGYDEHGFRIKISDDDRDLLWSDLPAQKVLSLHRGLLRDTDGERWLRLAALLRTLDEGEPAMETALRRAVQLDNTLADRAQAIREGAPYQPPSPDNPNNNPAAQAPGSEGLQGPVFLGGVQPQFWGKQTLQVMQASTDELKAYAQDVAHQLNNPLALQETDTFLFYSDLPAAEARRWASLLDRMYRRLCTLFEVDRNTNIFRGKCLIIVFRDPQTYFRYHAQLYGFDATPTAGLCRTYGDGFAKVSFYRQPNEHDFAYILVHETVHAFLHRYESPAMIPSWINEGLAELIASELVEGSQLDDLRWARSTFPTLRRYRSMGRMMDAVPITGWQYGVAHRFTAFMIEQDRARYRAFIAGIKEGLTWQESLDQRYGIDPVRLVEAWGNSLGIQGLQP
ncbi:MAG: hypothetical protein RIG82_00985 [Phycisphaeraceae bacterium]